VKRLLLAAAATFALAGAFVHLATAQPPARPERLITLDAEDAYLPSVLKILAEKGDLNIITGPGVSSGRLSIHMRDVPVDQAVNLVVRAAGLAYERIGNSVLVAEPSALKEETGLSSYVVDLQYADANDVRNALKQMAAQIEVDRGGNRLIVVTSPRVIAEIQDIVARLDRPARQVMLEARVVEVSVDDTKELGIDWDLLNRQTFIVVEASPPATGGTATDPGQGSGASRTDQLPQQMPFVKGWPRSPDLQRQAKAVQAAIDLLVREGNARVLANPKIATLNGKEATMLIGSRIPFVVTGTTFAGGGAAQTQTIQREEVGIKLRITPLINADGYITTEINPEVSSVTDFRGENADLPVVATRQASTTVRLKDGSSVIIGGLLSEEKTRTVTKVPILGQIPGIGYLFQHHTIVSSKRDLVIEVTPRILPEQE
jgi:type IV pilus secretin PilQ/predicted competence protein